MSTPTVSAAPRRAARQRAARQAPVIGTDTRDRKRLLWAIGLLVPLLPLLSARLVSITGSDWAWGFGVPFVFVIIPLLDLVMGKDTNNFSPQFWESIQHDRYYRYLTYAFIPIQFATLFWSARLLTSGELSIIGSIGLSLTVGIVSGVAINTAHELGHKHPTIEQWLAKIALAPACYGHFFIEHNRGHHKNVSTPLDPASSQMGETFYEFWWRSVSGSVRSAVSLESTRARRTGRSFWSPRNDVLNAWAMSIALFAVMTAFFGVAVLPWMALQAIIGFSLLEIVNYLEHYGLLREQRPDGRYVRTQPQHSWNANNVMTNLLLFHLQRHSDHHANPTIRYQALRHFPDTPQLPTGYAGMIVLAAVPPLWRRVMDPKVVAHYGGDLSKINMHPHYRRMMESGALPRSLQGIQGAVTPLPH
ncbi:MAG: alkane 1-monooxygenase [Actinobacteria bacterium]|nr:alkane 1-monooxygenase [Actinomycetota bacterium]